MTYFSSPVKNVAREELPIPQIVVTGPDEEPPSESVEAVNEKLPAGSVEVVREGLLEKGIRVAGRILSLFNQKKDLELVSVVEQKNELITPSSIYSDL